MNNEFKKVLDLIKRTGDKLVFYDSTNDSSFVILPLNEYEKLMFNKHNIKGLTEQELLDRINPSTFEGWDRLSTKEILSKVDAMEANDLYRASLIAYPQLKEVAPKGWYFSGSGSTFFRIR